jgi:hypothetical protein
LVRFVVNLIRVIPKEFETLLKWIKEKAISVIGLKPATEALFEKFSSVVGILTDHHSLYQKIIKIFSPVIF